MDAPLSLADGEMRRRDKFSLTMRPISSWLVVALLFAACATCDAARHEPEHPNRARHSTAAAGVGEKHSPSASPKHAGGFPARHDPIEIQPGDGKTTGVIIFIHGLGGSPEKYTWLANDGSKNYARPGVKWIFPWSPELDVAVTQKREPAWFDMNDFHIGHLTDDRTHIDAAASYITRIIDEQVKTHGIDPRRIVVGGFSQGGAVALTAALRYPKRLGGILAMSTYLPMRDDYPEKMNGHQTKTPLFQAHGKDDGVLGMEYYFATKAKLHKLGFKNRWDALYAGLGHDKCDEEIHDLYRFLDQEVFGEKGDDLDEGNWAGGFVDLGSKERERKVKAVSKETNARVLSDPRGGSAKDPKQVVRSRLRDMMFRANALLGREKEAIEAAEKPGQFY